MNHEESNSTQRCFSWTIRKNASLSTDDNEKDFKCCVWFFIVQFINYARKIGLKWWFLRILRVFPLFGAIQITQKGNGFLFSIKFETVVSHKLQTFFIETCRIFNVSHILIFHRAKNDPSWTLSFWQYLNYELLINIGLSQDKGLVNDNIKCLLSVSLFEQVIEKNTKHEYDILIHYSNAFRLWGFFRKYNAYYHSYSY